MGNLKIKGLMASEIPTSGHLKNVIGGGEQRPRWYLLRCKGRNRDKSFNECRTAVRTASHMITDITGYTKI